MASNYSIHALMVGIGENWWRAGIMPCVRSDAERDKPVAYLFWLIEGPHAPVVIDTGYHPDYVAPEWANGKQFVEPPALLRELGIRSDHIETVVVTHFHQDHFTGFDYFPNAKFVIQRAELEFWNGPAMRHEIFNRQIRPKVRPALEHLAQAGRLELIDGDCQLQPGMELLKVGGHTPGSQMIAVETAAGKAVLCGDIAYTRKNIRDQIPVGWYYNLGDTAAALERALAAAARPELAFPNHDPEILDGKRIARIV
ncbi:MAG TPA: N-acyl homoserine lactonase family protein [Candidatus Binatia bacterium]|nr:N-acyl homoserine lactonase family protein [Candidatus Binatia bacterium]